MNETKKKIVMAVANGCRNRREVARKTGLKLGTINSYFYKHSGCRRFKNGEWLQWDPMKANTLQLGPAVAIMRNNGSIVNVGLTMHYRDFEQMTRMVVEKYEPKRTP